eukprot:10825281-Karenia_brevis.AAC.1
MALDVPTHDGRNCMHTVRSCLDHYLKEEPVDEFYRWAGCQNCGESSGRPLKYLHLVVASQNTSLSMEHHIHCTASYAIVEMKHS